MQGTTHIIGGVAAAIVLHSHFQQPVSEPIIYYSAAIAGAILPDICHPKSMIGRRLPILSTAFSKIFGHRSLSHSLLFMVALYLLTAQTSFSFQTGLLIGVGSHLLLDMMTAQGIKLLYPLKLKVRTPLYVKTGSLLGEGLVNIGLILIITMSLFHT
ncbi:metal-dependent hydrolase [Halalkalibacter akibai]|uniref:Membrane-bound metal-dependent hydrolase YdjM n=1 Tax=Halalkalibacter akibai (strain ATCC 43226 / DSM 21942 / CIP 109018 / JCM 9157 / 1139) TaxID=1236973 RepID=W4QY33_HALA3|nr:metal-dependent hydrolase [Halalkalibacter akibai]GAE36991.1 membrane-bound metal-dependent hydrolase YdjM [Halalkalibacter akibai JCM 9157]